MLNINLSKKETPTGIRMAKAFFDCCNKLSMDPFEKVLDDTGIGFFDFAELCAFMDDMSLSFYQRLVRLEQTGSPDFTSREIATGCGHMPPERVVYLFQYLDHQKQWIPELDMAFHLHFKGERLLRGISRCYTYEGHHKVTLSHILTSPEGTDYYPGETVPYGWMDYRDREALKIKLIQDREQFRATGGE